MNYAFGYAGDRDLMRYAKYKDLWLLIESPDPRKTNKFTSGQKLSIDIVRKIEHFNF